MVAFSGAILVAVMAGLVAGVVSWLIGEAVGRSAGQTAAGDGTGDEAGDATGDGLRGSSLPAYSSLCGACVEACPVKIPLDDQLVMLRARAHRGDPARGEAALFAAWARLWSRPSTYRATAATAGRALRPLWSALARDGWQRHAPFPFSGWTEGRDARAPDPEPFHVRWRRRRGDA